MLLLTEEISYQFESSTLKLRPVAAVAVAAVVGPPPEKETVGALVYRTPPEVIVTDVTCPPTMVAVAAAAVVNPPPEKLTVGADV